MMVMMMAERRELEQFKTAIALCGVGPNARVGVQGPCEICMVFVIRKNELIAQDSVPIAVVQVSQRVSCNCCGTKRNSDEGSIEGYPKPTYWCNGTQEPMYSHES